MASARCQTFSARHGICMFTRVEYPDTSRRLMNTSKSPCDAKAGFFRKLRTIPVEVGYPNAPTPSASK